MKLPWNRVEDKVASAIVNLKIMFDGKIKDGISDNFEKMMKSLNLFKKSEQIKHNRLEQRIVAMEACLKVQLEGYHKSNDLKEIRAAKDASVPDK